MLDLAINNSGDIELVTETAYPVMRIRMAESAYPVIRVRFNVLCTKARKHGSRIFKINFDAVNKARDTKIDKVVRGNDELCQRVMMLLRTETGDISYDTEYGSDLNLKKHKDILEDNLLTEIEELVLAEVRNLLTEPSVKVVRVKGEDAFYCQTVRIYVMEGGRLMYETELSI